MSSKITKRMISRVDDMVARASSATQGQDVFELPQQAALDVEAVQEQTSATELGTKKRKKTTRRALLGALSSKGSDKKTRSTALAVKSGRITKKARKTGSATVPRRSLLEEARKELRGKSKASRNVSLLTYSRQQRKDGVGAKAQRAVEQLLLRDQAAKK